MTISERLSAVRARMDAARKESLWGQSVTLLAVTKTHGADVVRAALAAGHMTFAENRVQEAAEKFPALCDEHPNMRLHLIGMLQTNKIRDAVRLFDVIHTVDRPAMSAKLANEMAKQNRQLDCFIQVNTGAEPQKAGVLQHDLPALLEFCRTEAPLNIVGFMCIPPLDEAPAPHFRLLAELAREYQLRNLSMGMSNDFEEAVRLGATHIRVGSAIFGERVRSDK